MANIILLCCMFGSIGMIGFGTYLYGGMGPAFIVMGGVMLCGSVMILIDNN